MVGPGDAQYRKPFTLGRTKYCWDRPSRASSAGSVAARTIGSAAGIDVFHMSGIHYYICYCGDGAGNRARAGVTAVVGEGPSVLHMPPTNSERRARLEMVAAAVASSGLPHPPAPAHGEGVKTAFVSGVRARCAAGRRIFLGWVPG